jgi:ankyrin repeat protein
MKRCLNVFLKEKILLAALIMLPLGINYWLQGQAADVALPSWLRADTNNEQVRKDLAATNGANIEARNWLGQTGLMYAITTFNIERFHILLKYGADVNARSSQAAREEDETFNNTPLHYAVKHTNAIMSTENTDIIDELVDEGADVNAQNNLGETPLMWSLHIPRMEDRSAVVKRFIADMADVNLQNNIGDTYFMIAIKATDRGWLQYFMDTYGSMIDYNIRNHEGMNTLDYAISYVHPRYIQIVQNRKLVGFGDRVNDRDILGRTGLMLAIIRNDYPFAERQLQYHADVEATDATRFENHPLHFALMRRANIGPYIKLLLDNGAQVNIQNRYGDTPLHYLVRYNFSSLERDAAAEQMIAAGADPTIKNRRGKSVIDEAKRKDPGFAQQLAELVKKYKSKK